MDLTAIQSELELLDPDDQNRIAAFLTMLRLKREGILQTSEKGDTASDKEKWINWKDAKSDLGLED